MLLINCFRLDFLEEGKIGETRGNNWNEAFTNNKLNPPNVTVAESNLSYLVYVRRARSSLRYPC